VVEVGFPADYTFINTSGYHSRRAFSTFLHFNLLLEKRLTKWSQAWQWWSLG